MRRPRGRGRGARGTCWLSRDRTESLLGVAGSRGRSTGSCHAPISGRGAEWQGLGQGAGDQTESPGQWPREPGLSPCSVTRRLVELGGLLIHAAPQFPYLPRGNNDVLLRWVPKVVQAEGTTHDPMGRQPRVKE